MKGRASVLLLSVGLAATNVWAQEEADPLAELAALGAAMTDQGQEGGGSIRAKKDADLTRTQRQKDKRNVEAKVEQVRGGGFPAVAVRLKVVKPAIEGAGKSITKGEDLVVVPKLKVNKGKIDMEDEATLINAGTYYLQEGDKVVVRLGEKKGNLWEAEYIERK